MHSILVTKQDTGRRKCTQNSPSRISRLKQHQKAWNGQRCVISDRCRISLIVSLPFHAHKHKIYTKQDNSLPYKQVQKLWRYLYWFGLYQCWKTSTPSHLEIKLDIFNRWRIVYRFFTLSFKCKNDTLNWSWFFALFNDINPLKLRHPVQKKYGAREGWDFTTLIVRSLHMESGFHYAIVVSTLKRCFHIWQILCIMWTMSFIPSTASLFLFSHRHMIHGKKDNSFV